MIAIHEWCGIVEEILSILLRVFPTELRDTYLTTVIEQVNLSPAFLLIVLFVSWILLGTLGWDPHVWILCRQLSHLLFHSNPVEKMWNKMLN